MEDTRVTKKDVINVLKKYIDIDEDFKTIRLFVSRDNVNLDYATGRVVSSVNKDYDIIRDYFGKYKK